MMSFSVTLFALLGIVFGFLYAWYRERKEKLSVLSDLGIPGPPPHFITGNFRELRRSSKLPIQVLDEWLEKYGDVMGYYIGPKPFIVVKDLDIINDILVKKFSNFVNRPSHMLDIRPIKDTVVFMRDQRWKNTRSTLSPTFSAVKLRQMSKLMTNCSGRLVELLKQKNGEAVDMYDMIQGLTCEVIAQCALALPANIQENPKNTFRVSVREFLRNTRSPIAEIAEYFPRLVYLINYIIPKVSYSGRMTEIIIDNLEKVIAKRKQNPSERHIDVLQLMLDAAEKSESDKKSMTDEEIIANAWVFMLAGFETTASAMTFTSYLIAKHPEVQERLYQEVITEIEGEITTENVSKLQYLRRVIAEALRMYPSVPLFVMRQAATDIKLGNYTIKAGMNVQIAVYQIHHDPKLWPEPSKFDPDRFLPEAEADMHPMQYLPFGLGPRHCLGKRFAELELKEALAHLIKNFRFELCKESNDPIPLIVPNVTLNPEGKVMLKMIQRK